MSFTSVLNKALDNRKANVAARNARKIANKQAKMAFKADKFYNKYGAKAVAYQAGINPADSLWGGLTGVSNAVAGGIAGAAGGTYVSPTGGGSGNTMLLVGGAAVVVVVLLLMFNKN